jgi:hypothetical protein
MFMPTSTFITNEIGTPLFLGYTRTCTLVFSSKPMNIISTMMKKENQIVHIATQSCHNDLSKGSNAKCIPDHHSEQLVNYILDFATYETKHVQT